MTELVRSETVDAVRIWTVDRPEARNAISGEVAESFERAVASAETDHALRAVILTGAGSAAFVSGADLKFLRSAEPDVRAAMDARMVEQLYVPVIAPLNGPVVGGGMEVALACDLRIAEPHVSMTFKHAAMAVTPGWGGFARLARTVGRSTAAKLLFSALPIPAEEALRVGLIDEVTGADMALSRALALAQAIALTSPGTVRELKQLLRVAYAGQLTLEEEQRVFLASTRSADHGEALDAFFSKRAPRFLPR
jgi:enoyl-CoA hydratase/carnithine racemase